MLNPCPIDLHLISLAPPGPSPAVLRDHSPCSKYELFSTVMALITSGCGINQVPLRLCFNIEVPLWSARVLPFH